MYSPCCDRCDSPMNVLSVFALDGLPGEIYQLWTCRKETCKAGQCVLPWIPPERRGKEYERRPV